MSTLTTTDLAEIIRSIPIKDKARVAVAIAIALRRRDPQFDFDQFLKERGAREGPAPTRS
jgi:hypothetical protein